MAADLGPFQGLKVATEVVFHNDERGFMLSRESNVAESDSQTTVTLQYLAEGGANVVYTIGPSPGAVNGTALPRALKGKLLRLRKGQPPSPDGDPGSESYVSTAEIGAYFDREIASRLPRDHLVTHDLVNVHPEMLRALNIRLAEADDAQTRPKGRAGERLREPEPHGFLMDDMRPVADESFTIEFKPKWLSDAPNLDDHQRKRCRTCALTAMRTVAKAGEPGVGAGGRGICPLSFFVSGSALIQGIHRVLDVSGVKRHPLWSSNAERITARLLEEFESGQIQIIMRELARLEAELDPYGCLAFARGKELTQADGNKLGLAMTLRDCTMFLRFGWATNLPVELKLADLDEKDWRTKLDRWQAIETKLVKHGWYTGTEENPNRSSEDEETCILWNMIA